MAFGIYWTLYVCLILVSDIVNGEVCRRSPCKFTLNIRNDRTMIYRPKAAPQEAYKVGINGSRLQIVESLYRNGPFKRLGEFVDDVEEVITADGISRNILTINGKFPGPTIEVKEGVTVVVKVVNWLRTDSVSIHWHGLHQKRNLWMDGAAFITQCPITPYQSFTYRFLAAPAGTHWYHGHNGLHRIDGLYGMLIIHPKGISPPPSHTLMVADWLHDEGTTLDITNPFDQSDGYKGAGEHLYAHPTLHDYGPDGVENAGVIYTSGLINGRGRYDGNKLPLSRFRVDAGFVYRFRSVNSGAEFSFVVSVDGHALKVVALDGTEVVPRSVDAVVLAPGETVDFEIEANQEPGLFWLRARTLPDTSLNDTFREVLSIIQYAGFSSTDDPVSLPRKCTLRHPCKMFNCPFENYPKGNGRQCVNVADMRTVDSAYALSHGVFSREVDTELFLNGAFNPGSSINGRMMLKPNAPLFMKNGRMEDCSRLCIDETKPCLCSANYSIPTERTIQLVLSNLQYDNHLMAHHPMHLHGHTFAVLKIGYGTYNANGRYLNHTNDIICDTSLCRNPRWRPSVKVGLNLDNPPIKNTVVVPARGYVVVRFRSDNPGRWLFHCHTVTHHVEGMSALIMEGEESLLPPVPNNFPTCYGFERGEYVNPRDEEDMWGTSGLMAVGIVIGMAICIVPTMVPYILWSFWKSRQNKASSGKLPRHQRSDTNEKGASKQTLLG